MNYPLILKFLVFALNCGKTIGNLYNVSLDLDSDVGHESNWCISPTNIPKWLEYYNSTNELKAATIDPRRCPSVISEKLDQLENVRGIWMACKDPELPQECYQLPSAPCHPELSHSENTFDTLLRIVSVRFFITGFAMMRLTFSGDYSFYCAEFGKRRDPFSKCVFYDVSFFSDNVWIERRIQFREDANNALKTFRVYPIARFHGDAVLIDKIEAMELPTVPTHPTTTTPKWTWPTTTPFWTGPTGYSTEPPTGNWKTSKLDTLWESNTTQWQISNLYSDWLSYYSDRSLIIKNPPAEDDKYCKKALYYAAKEFYWGRGLWTACHDPSYEPFPQIKFSVAYTEKIMDIYAKFYLDGMAVIRLYVGSRCYDYSIVEHPINSPCEFRQAEGNGTVNHIYWRDHPNSWVREIELELVTTSSNDAIMLDHVTVDYLFPSPLDVILNTQADVEDEEWLLSSLYPNWLDYHESSSSIDPGNSTSTCANSLYAVVQKLPEVQGLWTSCHDPIENPDRTKYPVVSFLIKTRLISSIKVDFYLLGSALLRFHANNTCADYSIEKDLDSACEFRNVSQDGEYWRGFFWRANMKDNVREFSLELVTRLPDDLVVLDEVHVQSSLKCDNEDCVVVKPITSMPTTTQSHDDTTPVELTTSTEEHTSMTTEEPLETTEISDSTEPSSEASQSSSGGTMDHNGLFFLLSLNFVYFMKDIILSI